MPRAGGEGEKGDAAPIVVTVKDSAGEAGAEYRFILKTW